LPVPLFHLIKLPMVTVKEELEMMVLLKKPYVEEPIPCNLYKGI
jgi:hypothetical protein